MFIFVLSPNSLRNIEDGQRLLSDKVRSGNSNNFRVWCYDLSMVLCLGRYYTCIYILLYHTPNSISPLVYY